MASSPNKWDYRALSLLRLSSEFFGLLVAGVAVHPIALGLAGSGYHRHRLWLASS